MQDLVPALRVIGMAVGLFFVLCLLWIVLLGPAMLVLINPR